MGAIRSRSLLGRILALALGVAAAAGAWRLVHTGAERTERLAAHLTNLPAAERTRAVERRWIDEAFPRRFLAAPARHLPCPVGIPGARSSVRVAEALTLAGQGQVEVAVGLLRELHRRDASSWLPGLALGTLLAREGRRAEAGVVFEEIRDRWPVALTVREALRATRIGRPWDGPDAAEVLGAIHVLHAASAVRIANGDRDAEVRRMLDDALGCARLLAVRGETDRVRGTPVAAEHRLPAPGCESSESDLTTLDLHNNLIVGTLGSGDLEETPERRRAELARSYNDPPAENPLLAVLRLAAVELGREREPWLWAVSSAERLLKERRQDGLGEVQSARLALNLAELTDSALEVGPPSARGALLAERGALAAIARRHAGSVPADQRPPLARGIVRLALVEAVRQGAPAALVDSLTSHLDRAQRSAVDRVAFALGRRQRPAAWLETTREAAALDGGGAAREALGDRAATWLVASRQDLAAALAGRAAGRSRQERLRWIWRAQSVLARGDPRPAELAAAEQRLGPWRWLARLSVLDAPAAELAFAAIVGALAWIAGAWGAIQLRHRRDLLTSFYRREARSRLGDRR